MSLSQEERKIMVEVELERAERMQNEFPIYIEHQLWSTLVNRMYYAVFHAATALLIKNGLRAGTHHGVYIILNKNFIKEGILSSEEGRLFSRLATLREKGDYNCFLDPNEVDILPLLEPTKAFIEHIKKIISE